MSPTSLQTRCRHVGMSAADMSDGGSSWHDTTPTFPTRNGIVCHLIFGGRTVVSSQTILRDKKIDVISRQWGCDKAVHSTHHSCNNPIDAAEKRDPAPRIRPVYHKLIESELWDAKKDNKWKQPMIAYIREGWIRKSLVVKQEPSGWKLCLQKSMC